MRRSAPTNRRRVAGSGDGAGAALFAELARLTLLAEPERMLWGSGFQFVAGVDEVGRGSLAGPVVAAAVILPPGFSWPGIDDSKRLEESERSALAEVIRQRAVGFGISSASSAEVDRENVARASLLAMAGALEKLTPQPQALLSDAFAVPGMRMPQVAIIHGDATSISIAAASIVAKDHRDRLMTNLGRLYPGYGFERHKGYGVTEHLEALRHMGPCREHRLTFRGVCPEATVH